jgi:transcriptional regulator with XRE-family HTH domain
MQLGLNQAQAAARLHINAWTVLNWETATFSPSIRSIPAILSFLGYDPFPEPTTVGERLLQARRRRGWSIQEAAKNLAVDQSTWGSWERGEVILFKTHRKKVAQFLFTKAATPDAEMRAVEWKASKGGVRRRKAPC